MAVIRILSQSLIEVLNREVNAKVSGASKVKCIGIIRVQSQNRIEILYGKVKFARIVEGFASIKIAM